MAMDHFSYEVKWDKKELNKFKPQDFSGHGFDAATIDFLTTIGLPESAAPFLSFDRKKLNSVKDVYHLEHEDYRFLFDIGSDGAGDPICIDIKREFQIVALDHEDNFSARFVNSSVRELFAFLTIYKEFAESLIKLRGDNAFIESNVKDEEIEELVKDLKFVDARALSDDETFWSREIGMFIANRDVK
jgi:hypothetical protein